MADISKIKLPDETEVNLKDAQAFANIENDGQGGSSYTITRRDGTTKQVTIPNVTTTDPGLMTASDKTKIDTIEQGAEVNQQAFSKIRITKGSAHTDLDADTKTDTLELIEGNNITLTPSAVSDAVTIHAKDTIYTLAQDATDGHIIILTNNDESSTDHVQTITIPDNNTTYTVSLNESTNEIVLTDSLGNTMKTKPSNASTSLDGFMSKNDKSKLDGIASGAEVNQNAFSNVVVDDVTISADNKTDTLTFIAGSNITITPNATNDSITIASSYTNTTYELTQDATDGHKFTLSGSNGYTKTITIPDNNTTYTLSVGTGADANQIVFTPSSGSATKITVPYATKALQDADGNVIKDTYAASFSISDHTITLKNKSGVSLGTVTVPDNNTTYTFAEGTTNKAFSVTPSGGSAQTVPIHGLGSASEKNFTTSVTSGSADLVTSGAVASAISTAIDNLPEPMIFKGTLGTNGTITSLPTASSSNEGWTYKVITAGTYASQAAKVGDMFVSAKIGSAYQWVYVPSGDDVEDTWRNIKVNGTEKLGTGISSGAVDFVDGDFINITYANNKITVSHADTSSQASVSNSGRTYIQSVTLDGAGHVTKLTSATETVVNTDRYVNSASFADDTTASANSPVKMTLTRAGSDTATVTANIPKVSASSAGVAPKGAAVSSQSQSTKFLREDGTWSAPSYTVNTDTKVTSVGNHYVPAADSSAQLSASASGGTAAWSIDVVQGVQLQRDAKGHVVGVTVTSGKIPGNPNTNYYHKTGSWSGLTYTAGKVGSPDDLAFTIPTGTSATTVAVGNHTHSTTIATSTGTNQLTLSHGGKYAITTGGTSFVFTMPTDNNTDTNVTQTATNTNANYEVLFSGTADNTTRTEGARKYSNLTFNPSTGTLTTTKVVSANATLGVADIDTANITEDNVGNLIVTGAARFLNTINGSISGNATTASDSAKLNGYASDTSATNNTIARRTANGYIFATYFNQSSGAETPTSSSYIIYANSDGYFRKSTVANMKTAMSLNNVENKSSATIRGELTSANVTTALGYTPVNKAGDTITGRIAYNNVSMPLSAGKVTSLAAGTTEIFKDGIAISNPATFYDVGWIRVTGTGESDTVLEIATGDDGGMSNCEKTVVRQYNTSNAVAREAVLLNTDGTSSFPVSVTAPKFIGNLQGTADNADKVDGYHIYYDRYVSSTQLAQPTADTIWYVKVSTANWNSNIEVIQIRTGGNNRTGSHVLYTGSRGTKWWGYGQVYSHRGLSGVYKVISNSDDVYLRFDADCTSATIYTSFTPQTLAIVDSPSGANYTEVPTYGGWYGNQITVDHIQTNNYITIQKQTVASSTFADTNPKIVFKNADGSQSGSLTWTDYDSVQSPASLTLNGTQGGEYFIAPNIKATGSFYGTLSGHASLDLALTGGTMTGQIISNYNQAVSWLNCGKYPDIHINNTGASGWIGGNTKTGRHVICTYASSDDLLYFNWYSNTTLAGTENKFDKSFTWNPSTNVLSANISGNATTATTAQYVSLIASNEIRFANKPSSAVDVYFNYQWADGTASAMINKYVFMNGNKTKCPVEASKFIGPLQGNADTATSATKATQDGSGNTITSTYFRYYGATATDGESSLFTSLGTKQYNNALPDGLTSVYKYGQTISICGTDARFDMYVAHTASGNGGGIRYRSGWGTDKQSWRTIIDSATIGSQSVNYATSAGSATKATQDSDGNTISSTYVKVTGDPTIFKASDIAEGATNLSTQATAHRITVYRNGMTIPYQMDNANDGGMIRVRGTSESNCIFELGTWDDSGTGETIQFNYYPTTSQVTPTYSVTVPKATGTLSLTNQTISNITRSGTTFTATRADGTTFTFDQKDDDTKYGISASADNITLTAGGTGTTVQAHLCYNIAIGNTTDWNTFQNAGAYKVQMASWGDADTYHSPNKYKSDLYSFGMLYVVKSGVSGENRIFQYYIPHSTTMPLLVRSHNGSSWDSGWSSWYPIWVGIGKSDVGLGNVENKSSATIRSEITSSNVTTALGYTPANSTSLANYLPLAGGTMTGQIVLASTGYKTNSTSGYVVDQYGNFKHQSTNTGEYWVISNNAGTAKFSVYWETGKVVAAGDVQSATTLCANTANSSTAGGLSLYGTDPTTYGVLFRGTGNQGKHGYVQSDWATYFTMDGADTRGWVFKNAASGKGNVASISSAGNMVLNGSLTIGGNATNTSGCRLVYSSLGSLDFVFI